MTLCPSHENRFRRILIFCTVLLVLLMVQAVLLPSVPIWTTDNGNKIMTARQLAEHGTDLFEAPGTFDAAKNYFPGTFHFHLDAATGKFRSILPVIYPFFSSLLWRLGGFGTLLFLPVLGTVLTFLFFLLCLQELHISAKTSVRLAVLLLISAPYLFYSGTVWEMTLSCVFPVAAWYLLLKKHHAASGIVLGAGIWLREEFAVIAAAIFAAEVLSSWKRPPVRQLIAFSAGVLIAALPLCLFNYVFYGHILGFHGALYYTHNAQDIAPVPLYLKLLRGYRMYLFRFDNHTPFLPVSDSVLLIPFALMLLSGAFRGFYRTKRVILAVCAALWMLLFLHLRCFLNGGDHTLWNFVKYAGFNVGFITCSPLYAGFFLLWRELLSSNSRTLRVCTWTAVLYCIVIPPILTQSDIGMIWGARHFLMMSPLFLFLSFWGLARLSGASSSSRRLFPVSGIFFLSVASFIFCIAGQIALFFTSYQAEAASDNILNNTEDVIVTDIFFLPEMTPELMAERRIFYVDSDESMLALLPGLKRSGIRRFDLILSTSDPCYGVISDECLARMSEMPDLTVLQSISIKSDTRHENLFECDVIRSAIEIAEESPAGSSRNLPAENF